MGLWTLHGVYRARLTLVTLIGRAQPRVRAQPGLSPATARLTGSPFGSRSTADRTFATFREFTAFSHSAAALTIESRDSLIDVQELSPATARLTGSPFGSRSTADRTFAPFREFPAFSHSAAALTIESRDSLSNVQACAGLADRSALPASFCQAVPPLLCDCSQSTAQRELLSPVDSDCCVCSLPCTRAVHSASRSHCSRSSRR